MLRKKGKRGSQTPPVACLVLPCPHGAPMFPSHQASPASRTFSTTCRSAPCRVGQDLTSFSKTGGRADPKIIAHRSKATRGEMLVNPGSYARFCHKANISEKVPDLRCRRCSPHTGVVRGTHTSAACVRRTPSLLTPCASARLGRQVSPHVQLWSERKQNPASRAMLPPIPPSRAQVASVQGGTTITFPMCAGVKQRRALQRRGPRRAEVRPSAQIAATGRMFSACSICAAKLQ